MLKNLKMNELILIITIVLLLIVPQFIINSLISKKRALLIKIFTGILFLIFIWIYRGNNNLYFAGILSIIVITSAVKNIIEYRKFN